MKKIKIFLPVVAVLFAVASVFAVESVDAALVNDVVTANQTGCSNDGKCTNTGGAACKIVSTNLPFYLRVPGEPVTCSVAATGLFFQN